MAANTLASLTEAGADPLVLAADTEVATWAEHGGWRVKLEPDSDLNQAASRIPGSAGTWAICHADLPLLSWPDVAAALKLLSAGRLVLAPSSDGGTSFLGGTLDRFPFSYGPGSFHRHLAAALSHDPVVIWRLGFALDLDDQSDLAAALRHPRSVLANVAHQ